MSKNSNKIIFFSLLSIIISLIIICIPPNTYANEAEKLYSEKSQSFSQKSNNEELVKNYTGNDKPENNYLEKGLFILGSFTLIGTLSLFKSYIK